MQVRYLNFGQVIRRQNMDKERIRLVLNPVSKTHNFISVIIPISYDRNDTMLEAEIDKELKRRKTLPEILSFDMENRFIRHLKEIVPIDEMHRGESNQVGTYISLHILRNEINKGIRLTELRELVEDYNYFT